MSRLPRNCGGGPLLRLAGLEWRESAPASLAPPGTRSCRVFITYFTEQPMSAYPEDEAREKGGLNVLTFSNRHFDTAAGQALYGDRLEEYKLVDEVGFDGIMLNEHHNTPCCMQPEIIVWSSILAAVTKHVKIMTLGIPLPLWDNPLQAAEAFAMVDMISGGRARGRHCPRVVVMEAPRTGRPCTRPRRGLLCGGRPSAESSA